jgi:AcrR family transcriptional regulator
MPAFVHLDKFRYFVNTAGQRVSLEMTAAPQIALDPKRSRILDGAMKVFLAYGYSRVTMDDIARSAEVSRPALYLVFKNKAEIYRALGAMLLQASADAGRTELDTKGPFAERMMAAIERSLIAMMERIRNSPHGAEILDMKNSLAGDLAAVWRDALSQSFGAAIAAEASRNEVDLGARGLTANALADLLLDGLEGMKSRVTTADAQREGARRLVTVIELALQH